MPAIFNEESRNDIRNKMLTNGFYSIKHKGYKKTSIEEIAKQSGIAKGTFYNFFQSKENFVLEIILNKNNEILKNIENYCRNRVIDTRSSIFEFVTFIFSEENENLYSYLTFNEIRQIISKCPDFITPDETAQKTISYLLSFIPNKNTQCDWKVIINYVRMISVIRNFDDTASFYKEVMDKNIFAIIGLIVDEIMGINNEKP